MTPHEITELAARIFGQPQFAHYTLTKDSVRAYRDELEDLPLPLEVAQAAVRSLLLEDDQRLPTPQAIRKRVLREAGFLAPSWSEAVLLIERYVEAYAADVELPELPGPVQTALDARGGAYAARNADNPTGWFAQLRDTYREVAARHDLFVSEPGGLEALREVIAWADAVKARGELLSRARFAAALLSEPLTPLVVPSGALPTETLQGIVSEAERRFGPLDEIDANPVDRTADLAALLERFTDRG